MTQTRWTFARYDAGAAYPENWIRIEETPGAKLVANLPPYRLEEAAQIVAQHNSLVVQREQADRDTENDVYEDGGSHPTLGHPISRAEVRRMLGRKWS